MKFSVLIVDYLVLESLMRHNLLQQHVLLPALSKQPRFEVTYVRIQRENNLINLWPMVKIEDISLGICDSVLEHPAWCNILFNPLVLATLPTLLIGIEIIPARMITHHVLVLFVVQAVQCIICQFVQVFVLTSSAFVKSEILMKLCFVIFSWLI